MIVGRGPDGLAGELGVGAGSTWSTHRRGGRSARRVGPGEAAHEGAVLGRVVTDGEGVVGGVREEAVHLAVVTPRVGVAGVGQAAAVACPADRRTTDPPACRRRGAASRGSGRSRGSPSSRRSRVRCRTSPAGGARRRPARRPAGRRSLPRRRRRPRGARRPRSTSSRPWRLPVRLLSPGRGILPGHSRSPEHP